MNRIHCHPERTREGSREPRRVLPLEILRGVPLRMTVLLCLALFTSSALASPTTQPWLLHLPGIGGHLPLDDHLIRGLHDGGTSGWLEIYDWTGTDRGLIALLQEKRHDEQSTQVAKMIAEKAKAYP